LHGDPEFRERMTPIFRAFQIYLKELFGSGLKKKSRKRSKTTPSSDQGEMF
jgi:hypothetical protein